MVDGWETASDEERATLKAMLEERKNELSELAVYNIAWLKIEDSDSGHWRERAQFKSLEDAEKWVKGLGGSAMYFGVLYDGKSWTVYEENG